MNPWLAYFLGICSVPLLAAVIAACLNAYEAIRHKLIAYKKRVMRPRYCPHERIRGIYGDAIMQSGWKRLRCVDCGRLLDGPVSLANAPALADFDPTGGNVER